MKNLSLNYSSLSFLVPSQYNILVRIEDGSFILYNSLTGARFALSSYFLTESQLSALEAGRRVPNIESLDPCITSLLINHGFLIHQTFDEIAHLEAKYTAHAHNPSVRRVQVILTRHCNLQCVYCYQDKTIPDGQISQQDIVLKHLQSQVVPGGMLIITWFGGEPMLRLNLICQMSDSLIASCSSAGTEYVATISTNGVLLNREKIALLLDRKVRSFQITLDGPEKVQNARRPAIDGKPTYAQIVRNLELLATAGADIQVKMVVDQANYETLPELFRDLGQRALLKHVKIAVQETEAKFAAKNYQGRFDSLEHFAQTKMRLLESLFEEGYRISEPSQRAEFCAATSPYCTAVDMAGNLYRCGSEGVNKTGYISKNGDQVIANPTYEYLFTKRRLAQLAMCRLCKVLPICGGGCTLAIANIADRQTCSFFKVAIKDYLRLLHRQDSRERNSPQDNELTRSKGS